MESDKLFGRQGRNNPVSNCVFPTSQYNLHILALWSQEEPKDTSD